MADLLEQLMNVLMRIKASYREIEQSAAHFRTSPNKPDGLLENELVLSVKAEPIDGRVCAVDGSVLAGSLHGIDVVAARAVGANFVYKNSMLISYDYLPGPAPEAEIEIRTTLDEGEVNTFKALFRLRHEIETAIACVGHFKPDVLLMDGSLLPHPRDRPDSESEFLPEYNKLVGKYKQLYSLCEQHGTTLIGVIKDSRARRFAPDKRWNDTLFLHHLLKERERTGALRCYEKKAPNEFGEWAERLKFFYVKCVANDYPLRVEFLSDDFGRVASIIASLSAINQNYGYPAVLIEADLRATLGQIEIERITDVLSRTARPLRSRARPFR